MKSGILPYDPGPLPTSPAPNAGESVRFKISGLPPYKDFSRSIRNPKHPRYTDFFRLRTAAIEAMAGRAWYHGPIDLGVVIWAQKLPENRTYLDYVSGIMDTLDGSHGPNFTYLPICYEDDCQVCTGSSRFCRSDIEAAYEVTITFLPMVKELDDLGDDLAIVEGSADHPGEDEHLAPSAAMMPEHAR